MYEAVTRDIRVRATPKFLEEESEPDEGKFFWAYTIEISNEGEETVQLCSRHWRITDSEGRNDEVRGPGVVGKMPVLRPGESFRYTSGCPLETPSGIMVGTYSMTTETGEQFNVQIPAFSLDSPHAKRSLN
ncbi:MAG TPA: Co2+/Mg2+ efflux protein ApaG [Hyphomicrobiaceae bacterium]|nr:Co2+/Mg2+ efflux protein ApaG [Hyphomicrobiaceae bacterium]